MDLDTFDPFAPFDIPEKKTKPVARKNCQICIRDLPFSSFAKIPTTADCTHERNLCRPCLRQWIDIRLNDGQFSDIKCPGEDCVGIMTAIEIQRLISPITFKKFQNFAWRAQMNAEPRWRWCPAARCGGGDMRPDRITVASSTTRCKLCGVKSCLLCDKMHENESCAEFLERTETVPGAEKASETILAKTTKVCPNKSCASRVIKISGCDHMTCSKCSHQFCWECLKPWMSRSGLELGEHAAICSHHHTHNREIQVMNNIPLITPQAFVRIEHLAQFRRVNLAAYEVGAAATPNEQIRTRRDRGNVRMADTAAPAARRQTAPGAFQHTQNPRRQFLAETEDEHEESDDMPPLAGSDWGERLSAEAPPLGDTTTPSQPALAHSNTTTTEPAEPARPTALPRSDMGRGGGAPPGSSAMPETDDTFLDDELAEEYFRATFDPQPAPNWAMGNGPHDFFDDIWDYMADE